jgi:hypothetical protein
MSCGAYIPTLLDGASGIPTFLALGWIALLRSMQASIGRPWDDPSVRRCGRSFTASGWLGAVSPPVSRASTSGPSRHSAPTSSSARRRRGKALLWLPAAMNSNRRWTSPSVDGTVMFNSPLRRNEIGATGGDVSHGRCRFLAELSWTGDGGSSDACDLASLQPAVAEVSRGQSPTIRTNERSRQPNSASTKGVSHSHIRATMRTVGREVCQRNADSRRSRMRGLTSRISRWRRGLNVTRCHHADAGSGARERPDTASTCSHEKSTSSARPWAALTPDESSSCGVAREYQSDSPPLPLGRSTDRVTNKRARPILRGRAREQ